MIEPLYLLATQITFSFLACGVLGRAVSPWLLSLPRTRTLEVLLWTHVPRCAPLALLAPGQADAIPPMVASTIAWGDFVSAILALIAIVAIGARREGAVPVVWVFTVVSGLDIVTALTLGLGNGVHTQALGFGWYILALYVPVVCVSQWMIAKVLVAPSTGAR